METKRYIQKRIAMLTSIPNWDDDTSVKRTVDGLILELEKISKNTKKEPPRKTSGKSKIVGVFRNGVLETYGSTAEIGELFGLTRTTISIYAKANRSFNEGDRSGLRFSYISKKEVEIIV
ncbi:hypothetical protein IGI57_002569 [Enterococcus sp. DIV0213j]|uniref:hypothetical protein n=1 Tax=Enterococcus sp. DIV0213j TaxID=2774649 RepID=UPI003D2B613C